MRGRQVFIGVSSTESAVCVGRCELVGAARGRSGRRGRVDKCLGGVGRESKRHADESDAYAQTAALADAATKRARDRTITSTFTRTHPPTTVVLDTEGLRLLLRHMSSD